MADEITQAVTNTLGINAVGDFINQYGTYFIVGIAFIVICFFAFRAYQNKKIYVYPVRILKQRNNGMVKEFNTSGGYIKKNGLNIFSIKMSKFKKKNLDKLPISEYMDEDNRIYYWQVSPDSPLIQVRRKFVLESAKVPNENFIEPSEEEINTMTLQVVENIKDKPEYKNKTEEEIQSIAKEMVLEEIENERVKEVDVADVIYSPVPTDLKNQAIKDIQEYKNTLGVDSGKQLALSLGIVIGSLIFGIIIFYISINQGRIPFLE